MADGAIAGAILDMYLTGVTLRITRDNVRAHIPEALPEERLKPVFVRGEGADAGAGAG
ncbi:hypothetical protein [Streptomyces sp. NPDC058457]|uniref:hypothetical protein n=1 Tax=Streptomyces sp. NPDC058457 TaxID=3346507 RepID=UPI003652FA15